MSLPASANITGSPALPVLWLAIYAARVALYLLSGALLARRTSPLGWRFWVAAPGFLAAAVEAGLAAALDTRLKPRGRSFIPLFALLLAASSAAIALLIAGWRR